MCMQQQVHNKYHYFPQKRNRVRVLRLLRRQARGEHVMMSMDMELKNLKLYLENMIILTENENLRNQAHKLHQENLALSSELQKYISKSTLLQSQHDVEQSINIA